MLEMSFFLSYGDNLTFFNLFDIEFSRLTCPATWHQTFLGCRVGAVVGALASYQCGPGSIPRSGVICGLSLLVLFSVPRGFLRVLRFPASSKTII